MARAQPFVLVKDFADDAGEVGLCMVKPRLRGLEIGCQVVVPAAVAWATPE